MSAARCHPERQHYSGGWCKSCYETRRLRKQSARQPTCHPDRPHKAKGLCHSCYHAQLAKGYGWRHQLAWRERNRGKLLRRDYLRRNAHLLGAYEGEYLAEAS